MLSVLVTGGCGFIGSNFIRYLLETEPDVAVVNFDALTYAGNLANLADLADHPRYRFVKGDITDRDAVAPAVGRRPRASSTSPPRATSIAASTTPGRSSAPTSLGTQVLLDAARELGVERYVQVSTDEVYGSLGADGRLHRGDAAGAEQPLRRQQGGRRPAGPQLRPHLRPAGGHHALLEQLRAVPVPREADPAVHQQPAARRAGAGLRRRPAGPRLDPRPRPLPRPSTASGATGRAGEVYNIGGRCEKTNLELTHTLLDAAGQAAVADPLRHGPARPRPPLRHRLHQDRARAGLAADGRRSSRGCARRSRGIADHARLGGRHPHRRVPEVLREAVRTVPSAHACWCDALPG